MAVITSINYQLTPAVDLNGDQYNLYLDPNTHLIARRDCMPKPDAKTTGVWEGYQQFGPLRLSLDRHFGGRHIYFSDVHVMTD